MPFLYPTSRQFPVDEVCEKIVRALEARNFDVPGIQVQFSTYGSGEQELRYVSAIEGHSAREGYDFLLRFHRPQGTLPGGRWNDVAAVGDLVLPYNSLSVYEDESGPTFRFYVGDNWDNDRESFMRGYEFNSRLHGKRRTYLCYRAACDCGDARDGHTHPKRRAPLLVAHNDLGREYNPQGDEPTQFKTAEIFEHFRVRLEVDVLSRILGEQ